MQHFLPKSVGRIGIVRPHENDFASMLAKLLNGPFEMPLPPAVFSGPIRDHTGNGSCYSAIEKW